jgi:hypothetical protein
MKRREFITLLGGAAAVSSVTWPLAALAQAFDNRPRRIAYLSGGSRAGTDKVVTAFLEGMRAHGYVEGRDFEIVRIEQSNSFAAGGVRMKIKTHSGGRIQTRIDREQVFERRGFPTFAPIFQVVGDEV